MTPQQIELVQSSFAKVRPIADEAAAIFYNKLFDRAPEVRQLFKSDMTDQGRKLMSTISVVVSSLTRVDAILPSVRELAVKHAGYGVSSEHYPIVGEALIETLAIGLGDDFTPDTRDAWIEAYELLSGVMIETAHGAAAE